MGGRYGLYRYPGGTIAKLSGQSRIWGPFRPRYNIARTQPVFAMLDDEHRVEELGWGVLI